MNLIVSNKRCLECDAPFGLVSYPKNERKYCCKECMQAAYDKAAGRPQLNMSFDVIR